MNSIFGIVTKNSTTSLPDAIHVMANSFFHKTYRYYVDGRLLLGKVSRHSYDLHPPTRDRHNIVVSASKIQNKKALHAILNIQEAYSDLSDERVLLYANQRWGKYCVKHFEGQWAFALWNTLDNSLFIARDKGINTPFFYYYDGKSFLFASSLKTLLSSPLIRIELNTKSIYTPSGIPADEQTLYKNVYQLTSAKTVIINADFRRTVSQYWTIDDIEPIRYNNSDDYVSHFLKTYTDAVDYALSPSLKNGIALSSGLDSGSVATLAAQQLKSRADTLEAFSFIPEYDTSDMDLKQKFADESEGILQTSQLAGNINNHFFKHSGISFIEAFKLSLDTGLEPLMGTNAHHIANMLQQANKKGVDTFLTGQYGNFSVSYTGNINSYLNTLLKKGALGHYFKTIRYLSNQKNRNPLGVIKDQLKDALPTKYLYHQQFNTLKSRSFLNDAVMDQIQWRTKLPDTRFEQDLTLFRHQKHFMRNKSFWQEFGSSMGLNVQDPTANQKLIELCIAFPNDAFIKDGKEKHLLRAAMHERMDHRVLYNPKRGQQSADAIYKLRKEKTEIAHMLYMFKKSPLVRAYLNLHQMENVFNDALKSTEHKNFMDVTIILLRGIHYGMFLLKFEEDKS